MANAKHTIVLAVNILSPNIYQVNIEKTNIPTLEPKNLADQAEPEASVMFFQANQKKTLVGRPISTADKRGLSFHHSEIFCKLSWNHPKAWPIIKRIIPKTI